MKLLTFIGPRGHQPALGVLLKDGSIFDVSAARAALPASQAAKVPQSMHQLILTEERSLDVIREMLNAATAQHHVLDADQVSYLPPIVPFRNVFCVGRNYREHIIEGNIANGRPANSFPEAIEFFTKATTTIVPHGAPVLRHAALTDTLDYEVELAIVIGKGGVNIPQEQALDHVFGYTIVNDITARNLQKRHGQWFKGKSLDTSCPIGPVILHRSAVADPNALQIALDVNGENRQSANTAEMIFNVQAIIAQLSAGMTLQAGDVIATGTPKGVGFAAIPPNCLQVGDVVTARVEGIGELINTIVD
jgi:2-keto-4-pentenoate hydratase/2-oxohepta-3-ene-1,7-dioic acid hydratase in catechol pathway